MQDLLKWTIDTIRSDAAMMSWLEERKFEWVPLVQNTLSLVLNGSSIIIITDMEREWFGKYVMQSINRPNTNRPIFPFFNLKEIYYHIDLVKQEEDTDLVLDMLGISFPNNYIFWYVGKFDDRRSKMAVRKDDSFIWVLDEEFQNSFSLSSSDDLLDLKLFQLFRLFDKSLSAALFGEIQLES